MEPVGDQESELTRRVSKHYEEWIDAALSECADGDAFSYEVVPMLLSPTPGAPPSMPLTGIIVFLPSPIFGESLQSFNILQDVQNVNETGLRGIVKEMCESLRNLRSQKLREARETLRNGQGSKVIELPGFPG
jgi:hypothetical protein